jgi:hypothetical protein
VFLFANCCASGLTVFICVSGSSPGPLAQSSGLSGLGSAGLDHSQVLAQHTDPSTGGVQWQISSGNKVSKTRNGKCLVLIGFDFNWVWSINSIRRLCLAKRK